MVVGVRREEDLCIRVSVLFMFDCFASNVVSRTWLRRSKANPECRKSHTLVPIETLASLDASNLPHQSATTASTQQTRNQGTYQARALLLPNVNNRMLSLGERGTHQTLPAPHAARRLRATGRRRRGATAIAPVIEAISTRCGRRRRQRR